MSKKLFAMLLALVMLLGVSNIALAEDPIELHFVCAYAANYGMQDLIDDFEAQHPNIKIILDVYNNSSDGNQAVDNMLMAGGLIDLQLAYGLDKTDFRASSDFYVNLDERVAEWGIDMQETFGVDIKFRNSEGEQHYFGIPVDALQWYICINMTEWEAAGLGELPTAWTWDEYIDACRKSHDGAGCPQRGVFAVQRRRLVGSCRCEDGPRKAVASVARHEVHEESWPRLELPAAHRYVGSRFHRRRLRYPRT